MIKPMTKKELATIAGYTYRRLYDIDRDLPEGKKLFVKCEEGKYDLPIFVQKWVEYNVANEVDDTVPLEVIKAKHEVVKTEKTELEVAKMRGQMIDVQDAKRLWGNIASTIMQNLIHLPHKIAPELQMQESVELIAEILDAEIRAILTSLSETPLPEYAAEDEEEGEDDE